eukprot:TRINITY_DN22542_c0_g2_i2.p1 TRINITY_DN22542_c0_g2~~TRINITY_DN22542_c0_g2_i2.p1  ORF type:complete len:317 (-),score=70.77 TRINITY_DN22542_c0_g2_i2:79-1029(-)
MPLADFLHAETPLHGESALELSAGLHVGKLRPRQAHLASEFLEVPEACSWPSAPSRPAPKSSFFIFGKKDYFELDPGSIFSWRKQHNYFLDRGMKFMINYRTPQLTGTDLFDLEKFGCFQTRGYRKKGFMERRGLDFVAKKFKKWWEHPRIQFAAPFKRVGVHLQDLTTGEVKWDAIYNLGQAKWKDNKSASESLGLSFMTDKKKSDCVGNDGYELCNAEKPIGGEHPYFQPDWCPAPNDGMAHKYLLKVTNLSQVNQPEQPLVGEIHFTQYPLGNLENTYDYENYAPASAGAGDVLDKAWAAVQMVGQLRRMMSL